MPGWGRLSRQVGRVADDVLLASVRGNTDSELAFTLFLTHLASGPDGDPPVEELAAAMTATARQITGWHREEGETRPLEMNFCVTTGAALVAMRFAVSDEPCPTLYWRETGGAADRRAVCVASEPLSEEPVWQAVANGEILLVGTNLEVDRRSLEFV